MAKPVNIEISKRLVAVNSAAAMICRILRLTVLVWLYQHLLQRVSADEFAVYALVMAVMVFAPVLSTLFTSGISRYVVEACARQDEMRVRQITSSITPVLIGWAIILLAIGGLFLWKIDLFLNVKPERLGEAQLMLALLLVDFAVQMVLTPFAAGFHVRQRFVLLNGMQIVGELLRIGLLFGLMLGVDTRVIWVVVSSVVANLGIGVVTTIVSRRLLPSLQLDFRLFDHRIARELFSFGLWSTVGHLAYLIYISADIILLNHLGTSLDVSNFKLGSEFYLQIQALVQTAIATILPALTAMHARGDVQRLGDSYLRGCRYCLWISMLIAAPLIVYGQALIRLYVGETYLGAASVMVMLLLLLPLTQTIGLLSSVAAAKARLREFSLTSLGVQLVKLVVTIIVLRVFGLGAYGCALVSLVVIGAAVVVVFWPLGLRLAEVTVAAFAREVLWRGLLPGGAAILSGFLLQYFHTPTSWLALAFHAGCASLIYLVVTVCFCTDRDEFALLARARKLLPI